MNSFIFYSSYFDAVQDCDETTQKNIYFAIINYIMSRKEPNLETMSNEEKLAFKLIKPILNKTITQSNNGKKGGAPLGNKNAKKQAENNPKTTQKQADIIKDMELFNKLNNEMDKKRDKERKTSDFLNAKNLSLSQKIFLNSFPNKMFEVNYTPPKEIDFNLLVGAIKESEFLASNNNLGFKWCCEHYKQILNGNYKNFKKVDDSIIHDRKYNKEELESLITPIDEIEL